MSVNNVGIDDMKSINDREIVIKYRTTLDNSYIMLLLNKYENYINKIIFKIYEKNKHKYSFDDIQQEVHLCFIKIVQEKYDTTKDASFFTYLYKTLPLNSLMFIREDKYYPCSRPTRLKNPTPNVSVFSNIILNFSNREMKENEKLEVLLSNRKELDDFNNCVYGDWTTSDYNLFIDKVKNSFTLDEFNMLIDFIVHDYTKKDLSIKYNIGKKKLKSQLDEMLFFIKNMYKEWDKGNI